MPTLEIEGHTFETTHIPTANTHILLVKAAGGFLACGYFDLAVANRVGDAVAIATGVKTIDELLAATIVKVSDKAREAGVTEGMTGRDSVVLLDRRAR
jgi:uncharacterized protein YunC (DUF1805 family)